MKEYFTDAAEVRALCFEFGSLAACEAKEASRAFVADVIKD